MLGMYYVSLVYAMTLQANVFSRLESNYNTTRIKTSIRSEARRNHTSILIRSRVSPLNLTDRQTYGRTYRRTDGH